MQSTEAADGMQRLLTRAQSMPGGGFFGPAPLLMLGTKGIKLDGPHGKQNTLVHKYDAMQDKKRWGETPGDAVELSESLKMPNWRTMGNEPRDTSNDNVVHRNQRWPRKAPAWLKHEKQVLRWYGYFQESVVERWDENSRYRNVIIMFSLEDGTIQISEPRVENSGITQGKFLRRHQVPRPGGAGFLGPEDFHIGEITEIYGRNYHITGCDAFTRWFFQENGIELPENHEEMKKDDLWFKTNAYNKLAEKGGLPKSRSVIEAKQETMYMAGAPPQSKRLVQFLQNDRKVLRFKGYWDDHTQYGNRIYFEIHYFLADNTMEINEAHCRNSGRDGWPMFYRRGPLSKHNKVSATPGCLEPDLDLYQPTDLMVGGTINVWGRTVVLYDCDDFTRNFYHEHLGIDQAESKIDVTDTNLKPTHQKLTPPPHNGVGTEEDSLINCMMIQPKPPRQDLRRLMTLSGECLRFEAKMMNGEPEDENRKFVLGFFPADNTTACWESAVRNSGHMGGKFAEKKKRKNPDTGRYFELEDFRVGATVTISSAPFKIVRADEHALQYLESRPDEHPYANPIAVCKKLAIAADEPEMEDPEGIDPDRMKEIADAYGVDLEDHEIITLLRFFCVSPEESVPLISGPRVRQVLGLY